MGLSNKSAKKRIHKEQNDDRDRDENQSRLRLFSAFALVTQLGIIIGMMTVGGMFLGRWADGENGTVLFTVIGTIAGLAAGLLSGYRLIKRALG